jgi:muramidase (phage lysozyme)
MSFPIPNLPIKILVGKQEVFVGPTDAKGQVSVTLNEGDRFEIQVKRDRPRVDGADKSHEYNLGAISVMKSREVQAGLQSKTMKFDFCTEAHAGSPGGAEAKKKATITSHNQKPEATPTITGNPNKKPTLQTDRDEQGAPKAVLLDGLKDWYGRSGTHIEAPDVTPGHLDKVKKLIEFAEKQAGWKYEKKVIASTYVQQMMRKTFTTPESKGKDGYQHSVRMCNKYVKIALWYAGFGPANEVIGPATSPAREMGPQLIGAGFKDITNDLPDARWAAPGDVIVYRRGSDHSADGHIDIRSYDGYISDFIDVRLPISQFDVTGIYRKYYDPEPALRVRAFLMVVASRESESIFKKKGYEATYSTLPGSGQFTDFSTHPYAGRKGGNTASGAYGIIEDTWRRYIPLLKLPEKAAKFTPVVQDRIVVTIMERTGNALALVRKGEIIAAADLLGKNNQIASMPSGNQSRGFTNEQLMASYNEFLSYLRKGK